MRWALRSTSAVLDGSALTDSMATSAVRSARMPGSWALT